MEVQAFILSLLLLALVSQTDTRSLDSDVKCATSCAETGLSQGITHQMRYEANFTSSFFEPTVEEEQNNDPEISIRASVNVSYLTPCELVLQITDASITSPDRIIDAQEWSQSLQRNPLHFSYQGTRIADVCASNDDPVWVLNIKRGIMSMLIFSPDAVNLEIPASSYKEDGVVGTCEWEYTSVPLREGTRVTKTIDYSKCEGRDRRLLISHFTPYYSESNQQSFIHSEQECELMLDNNGAIRSSHCLDNHTFTPFSSSQSRAKTTVSQKLAISGSEPSSDVRTLPSSQARRTSITFEYEEENTTPSGDIAPLQELIDNICEGMRTEHYEVIGRDFIKMVFHLRRLDDPALDQVYRALDGACPMLVQELKSMFQNALQWCGSESCVVHAARLLESGTLTETTAKRWITGMSLISEPTERMVQAMVDVVRSGRYDDLSFLATGNMVHKLTARQSDKSNEPEVVNALREFEGKLGVNCRTSNADTKQSILLALRAIGNAGQTTVPNTLAACASESGNDMETRIAAIQAFRRMPCSIDRSGITQIYLDQNEDSEVRISSYLAMMACPTPQRIRALIASIDTDPSKQFQSFVWTHMQQLQESSDPLKGYIKPFLIEAEFMKPVDLDPRKFSRYYEASLFSDTMNAGATVDSSVVWSPKSFVPRSANLDLTLDVFGQAVNLFEIGGRVEGAENALHSLLGPEGFLKNNRMSDLFRSEAGDDDDEGGEDEEEEDGDDEINAPARTPRSSSNARLRDIKQQYDGRVREESPSASAYFRVFGNEMLYKNTRGMAPFTADAGSIDLAPILARLAQGTEYNYHDDMLLMNSAYVIPTAAGLPLTLAFNGSASVDVTVEGTLDMQGLFNPSPSVNVLGSIKPRAVVVIDASMIVDAHVTSVGIATASSAVTSWHVGGKVSLERGRSLQVKIDAPYQRNTVFNFNHRLLNVYDNEWIERPASNEFAVSDERTCSEDVAGQRFCLENSISRHPEDEQSSYVFPKYGPVAIGIYMEKTDAGFDSYIMEANYETEYSMTSDIPVHIVANFVLDTPGSSVDRQTEVHAHYVADPMRFHVSVTHHGSTKRLRGDCTYNTNHKNVNLQYDDNGETTSFSASYDKQQDGSEKQWSLSSELQTPTKGLSGSAVMVFDPKNKVTMNISINNLLESPVVLNFGLQDKSESKRNRLDYRGYGNVKIHGIVDTSVRFNMRIKPKTDVFTFRLNYEFNDASEERIQFSHKRINRSTATLTDWGAEQTLSFSEYPYLNHYLAFAHTFGDDQITSYVKLGFGAHAGHKDSKKYLMFNQTFIQRELPTGQSEISGSVSFAMRPRKTSHSVGFSHVRDSSSFTTRANIDEYEGSVLFHDNSLASGMMDLTVETDVLTPWGNLRLSDRIVEPQNDMYHMSVAIGLGNTGSLGVVGHVYLDNLDQRKRLEVNFDGGDEMILHARSLWERVGPGGISIQNTIESKFNRLVNVSVRYEGEKEGGFESNLLVEHVPRTRMELDVDVENGLTSARKRARFDFKDHVSRNRFIQVKARKNSVQSRRSQQYDGDLTIRTDIPAIPFQSVQANGEIAMRDSRNTASASLNLNDEEIISVSPSYQYELSDGSSISTTTATVAGRQQITGVLPASANLTLSVENSENVGIDVRYSQDESDMLLGTFSIAMQPLRITGNVNQFFSTVFPGQLSVDVTPITKGFKVDVSVDEEPATVKVVRLTDKSVRATWSHSSRRLLEKSLPRSATADLNWGRRDLDKVFGMWLTGTVDRRKNFKAEIHYRFYTDFMADTDSYVTGPMVKLQVTHDDIPLLSLVPNITSETGYKRGDRYFLTGLIHRINDEVRLHIRLERLDETVYLAAIQNCTSLINHGLPQKTLVSLQGRANSVRDISANVTTQVDDIHGLASFTFNSELIRTVYKSNCTEMLGDFGFEIDMPAADGSFVLKYVKDQVEKQASVSVDFDRAQRKLDVQWSQNIYENDALAHFPRTGALNFLYTLNDDGFEARLAKRYNRYSFLIETQGSWVMQRNRGEVNIAGSIRQNILVNVPTLSTSVTATTDYATRASGSVSYAIGEKDEKRIRLELGYDPDQYAVESRLYHNEPKLPIPATLQFTGSWGQGLLICEATLGAIDRTGAVASYTYDQENNRVTLSFRHSLPILTNKGVYETFEAEVSVLPEFRSAPYSLSVNGSLQLDEDHYSAQGTGSFTKSESSVITISSGFTHDIAKLVALVPRHVATTVNLHYTALNGRYSGSFDTHVQVDERVAFRVVVEEFAFESTGINMEFELGHDIPTFHKFGVPLRIAGVTKVNCGTFDPSNMQASVDLTSRLSRTIIDDRTDTEIQLQNRISLSADMQIFKKHVTLTGSHDFDLPNFPRNVSYEISVSGSGHTHSPVTYKGVTMCLTRDGVKQRISVTMSHNTHENSFFLNSAHNVTAILPYGVPRKMSIIFQKRGTYDADLKVVYDTAKKSIGFKIVYNGQPARLVVYFSHNFDILADKISLPKRLGFDSGFDLGEESFSGDLHYTWGETIHYVDIRQVRWHLDEQPSLEISARIKHNITEDNLIPNKFYASAYADLDHVIAEWRVGASRPNKRKLSISCNNILRRTLPVQVSCRLTGRFGKELEPLQVTARVSDEEESKRLEVRFQKGRSDLQFQVDGSIDKEAWAGEITAQLVQDFVENDVFPTNMVLTTNASINSAFVKLEGLKEAPFQVKGGYGYNLETSSGYVEMSHLQDDWELVPKDLRVDVTYSESKAENMRNIKVEVNHGRKCNTITATNSYRSDSDFLYGHVSYKHDFRDFQEKVPMHGSVHLLLAKADTLVEAQLNVTMGEESLTHSINAGYVKEPQEWSSTFMATHTNAYLKPNVPHTISLSTSAHWGDNISGTARFMYGDEEASVSIQSDWETSASLEINHTWDFEPKQVEVSVSASAEDGNVTVQVAIDGIRQEAILSGSMQDDERRVRFRHGFENLPIPRDLRLSGSYRLSPDVHVSVTASVDDKQYSASGGLKKLENGFHVTTSLLDDIIRTATFIQNEVPAGLSFELDHNIPELLNYIPGSIGFSGSAGVTPMPNVTVSLRQDQTTQVFSAEADLKQLRFSLQNGFASLLIPESLSIDASGSTTPLTGHLRVVVNGIEKSFGGEVDFEQMQARAFHTAQELDDLFIPRDIAVGLKGSSKPLSGELYVSVDGLIRRVGGSVDRARGQASLYQSAPEMNYLPRNITLQISGSAQPLHGSISLTMDEVKHQASAEVVPMRSLRLSHTVPGLSTYVPKNLAVDFSFTGQSAQGSLSFTKDEAQKRVTFQVLTTPNILVVVEQNIMSEYDIPSHLQVNLGGSLDYKNVSVYVQVDESFVRLNGNLFTGRADGGWYGFNVEGHQITEGRFGKLFQAADIVTNGQVQLKGRRADNDYETHVIINVIEDHSYQAHAILIPELEGNSVSLSGEYSHTYEDLNRTIGASVRGYKSSNGDCSLTLEGEQNSPEHVYVRLGGTSNMSFGKLSEGYLSFYASHNVPQLRNIGVANTIEDTTLHFQVQPLSGNISLVARVDGQSYRLKQNWTIEWTETLKSWKRVVFVANPHEKQDIRWFESFEIAHKLALNTAGARVYFERTDFSDSSMQSDEIGGKVYYDSMSPAIVVDVRQSDLNAFGVPVRSEVSLKKEKSDSEMNWNFSLKMDDQVFNGGFTWEFHKPVFRQKLSAFANHNVTFLQQLEVPESMQFKETVAVDSEPQGPFQSTLEFLAAADHRFFSGKLTQNQDERQGTVSRAVQHNIPRLVEWLKWKKVNETYSWSVDGADTSARGVQFTDDVLTGNYTFSYNSDNGNIDYFYNGVTDECRAKYRVVKNGETFHLLLSISKNGANVFLIQFGLETQQNIQARFEWNLYGPEIISDFSHSRNPTGRVLSLSGTVTVDGVTYNTATTMQPHTRDGKNGHALSLNYQAGERKSFEVDIKELRGDNSGLVAFFLLNNKVIKKYPRRSQVHLQWNANSVDLRLAKGRKSFAVEGRFSSEENTEFSGTVAQNIDQLIDFGMPQEITAEMTSSASSVSCGVTLDEINVFQLNNEEPSASLVVRDLKGNTLLAFRDAYQLDPYISIRVYLESPPLDLRYRLVSSLILFEEETGNSSFAFGLEDLVANQRVKFDVYAYPEDVDAIDVCAGAILSSSMKALPFKLSVVVNSSSDADAYTHGISAGLNDEVVSAVGRYEPGDFELTVEQTWLPVLNVLTLSGTSRKVNEERNSTLKFQWGTEEDSLELVAASQVTALAQTHSLQVTQPSELIPFAKWYVKGSYDFSTPSSYLFKAYSDLDGQAASINVRYQGSFPRPLGHHKLVVDIMQPIISSIPKMFTTTGNMTISADGLYDSDWRITSQRKELVILKKAFHLTNRAYTVQFLWKQGWFVTPLRFISITSKGQESDGVVSGMTSFQVDNMPVMEGEFSYSIDEKDNRVKKYLELQLQSGPLSEWVYFRTLGFSAWAKQKSARRGRQQHPEWSITADVDRHVYHFSGSNKVKTSKNVRRFSGDITLSHPHGLILFGMPLPKENTGSWVISLTPKGMRSRMEYDNEFMNNPFRLRNQYRYGNDDVLLHGSTSIKYGAETADDDITLEVRLSRNDNDFDYVTAIALSYPDESIDGSLILNGLNSEETFTVEGILKNYDGEERKLWKLGFSYVKTTGIIQVSVNAPDIEETVLRGDFPLVTRQVAQLIRRLSTEAANTRLRLVKGMDETADVYDFYVGYEVDGDATYTVHLKVGDDHGMKYAQLETKRNLVVDNRVARVAVDLVNSRLIQLRLEALPALKDFIRNLSVTLDHELVDEVNAIANELVHFLESSRSIVTGSSNVENAVAGFLDHMIAEVNSLRSSFTDATSNFLLISSDKFDNVQQLLQYHVHEDILFLMDLVAEAQYQVARPITDFVDEYKDAMLTPVGTTIKGTLKPVEDVLSMINANELCGDLVDEALDKSASFLIANVDAALFASRHPMSELLLVTDSEITISIPLEFDLDRFVPLPTLDEVKTWLVQTALAVKIDDTVKSMYSVADKYYLVRSAVNMPRDELLPPFKGHAFVSGFRHFSTFDKEHFDFSSSCQTTYLLATDMRNHNFTVTMSAGDRNNGVPAAIELIVENRRVAVFSDYNVKLNGQRRSLPLVDDKISASLQGNVVHLRHLDGDVDVTCDFDVELCTIDVSPFYYGVTGGLVGRYNNEPSDDVLSPGLEHVPDVTMRANTWETSGTSCHTGNEYSSCDSETVALCSSMFGSSDSPFRSCFSLVDPEPYRKMCNDDMCRDSDVSKICSASAAYAYRCRLAGAPLEMPEQCSVCKDVSGGSFNTASGALTTTVTGVDLVFVAQEKSCLRRPRKTVGKFLKSLMNNLQANNLNDNQYYLVGYGGADGTNEPHSYTISGKPITNRKKAIGKNLRQVVMLQGDDQSDGLAAVEYAAQLPFRAGAKPVIILLSCDECSSDSSASYNNVEWKLRQHGIVFHHIPHKRISTGRNSKTVFGFDGQNAYIKQNIVADTSLVIKPSKSDSCVSLATDTGGSVWDASQMGNAMFRKKLARYIASQAFAGSSVSCQCIVNEAGIATSQCT